MYLVARLNTKPNNTMALAYDYSGPTMDQVPEVTESADSTDSTTDFSFGSHIDLSPGDVKQLLLAFSTILGASLHSNELPVQKWLQILEADLMHDTVYDEVIRTLVDNWRAAEWVDDAEATLVILYVKRLLFTIAAEVVQRRNESYTRRCLRRLRAGCGNTLGAVERLVSNTTVTAMTITVGTIIGFTLGKRFLRYV